MGKDNRGLEQIASTLYVALRPPLDIPQGRMASQDRYCALRSDHTRGNAEVDYQDLERLQPGGWLNGSLLDYKLFLHAATYYERGFLPSDCTFLPSYVWDRWNETDVPRYSPVTITNPLLSHFIAMPCCVRRSHWILVVVAYAYDLSKCLSDSQERDLREQRPAILIFDSLPSRMSQQFKITLEHKLRTLILKISQEIFPLSPEELVLSLPVYYPEVRLGTLHVRTFLTVNQVVSQNNSYDCGLICMHYLKIFLDNPVKMTEHCVVLLHLAGLRLSANDLVGQRSTSRISG